MFDRLTTLPHGLRVFVEALLYGLQYILMLPARDAPLHAGGAALLHDADPKYASKLMDKLGHRYGLEGPTKRCRISAAPVLPPGSHAATLAPSKGRRLIRCTVPGSTPNRAAIFRTPSVRPGLCRAILIAFSISAGLFGPPRRPPSRLPPPHPPPAPPPRISPPDSGQ